MSSGLDKYDDDEYIAKLLAEDAKKSSARYASVGLSALIPRRPTGSAPKPNTRFLRNLVREADSHNAALRKKEELESRIRLREIRDRERRQREEHDASPGRESKRRRLKRSDDDDDDNNRRGELLHEGRRSSSPRARRKEDSDDRERRNHRRPRRSEDEDRHRRRREHRRDDSDSDDRHHQRRRHGENDTHRDDERRRRHKHEHSHRSPSSHRKRRNTDPRSTSPRLSDQHKPAKLGARAEDGSHSGFDSDPLESHLKTLTSSHRAELRSRSPTTIRGRGFLNPQSTSNIDLHFSSNYDPSLDVRPDSPPLTSNDRIGLYGQSARKPDDDMGWDMALEALRDRAMWKRKQADRLREAGWDEDQIQKWESKSALNASGIDREGEMANVRWAKRGEQREWDRGKDLDQE